MDASVQAPVTTVQRGESSGVPDAAGQLATVGQASPQTPLARPASGMIRRLATVLPFVAAVASGLFIGSYGDAEAFGAVVAAAQLLR